jgi:hypothetical protein
MGIFAIMLMPKAPMEKNYFSTAWENQIWLSGQIFTVQSISIPHPKN